MNPIPIHARSRYYDSARYGWLWYVEEEKNKKEEEEMGPPATLHAPEPSVNLTFMKSKDHPFRFSRNLE
jgi:hypothetical protein